MLSDLKPNATVRERLNMTEDGTAAAGVHPTACSLLPSGSRPAPNELVFGEALWYHTLESSIKLHDN